MKARRTRQAGVTLVELVIVLTLLGLMASLGATLVSRLATEQQTNRARLMLAQSADGAMAQLQDQLQLALPNSVRVQTNADGVWIEWIPLLDAGVARLAPDTSGAVTDTLNFEDATDASFDTIGVPLATPTGTAWIVWQNLGSPEADAYAGTNRRGGVVLAAGGTRVSFTPAGALPAGNGSGRFFLVGAPRSVACRPVGSGWDLMRYSGYGWLSNQPASSAAVASATAERMASGLESCMASYSAALANIGLLNLRITAQDVDSAVRMTLVQQIAIDNAP